MLSSVISLLCGCTLDLAPTQTRAPSAIPQRNTVMLQRLSSAPNGSYKEISEEQLKPGDLLFSSSIGVTSLGIRLFSTSAVSHVALYIGEGYVSEATGAGVQIVTLSEALAHSDKLFVLRHPSLTLQQEKKIAEFSKSKQGTGYNYTGIVKMIPFMLTKQLCSLNPFSRDFRQQCITGLASSQIGAETSAIPDSYFCSEFVAAAYQYAGQPLTRNEAAWVSPSDLLHMREGDVPTLTPVNPLRYVGHLSPGIYIKAGKWAQLR